MRNRLFFVAGFLLFFANASFAQIVGGNGFLQGHWLEIGEVGNNGSFGTTSSPVGYHPHLGGPTWVTGQSLGEVYDYGHDGWSVGTPPLMGDYTYPGFPFEGWYMSINGTNYQNYQGTSNIPGTILTYSNTGGIITTNWASTGTASGLKITQETRVDTNASWVVITTRFYNTTGAAVNNIYYTRCSDPDNDVTWPGGTFTTTNTIVHQNDWDHRVQVSSLGPTGPYTYSAICTKDCRAKAYINPSYTLQPITTLSTLWAGAGGFTYTGTTTSDQGTGIVWNLGTLNAMGTPGDSTVISCAYIYTNDNGIDSALPDPVLSIGGTEVTTYPDTFNLCSLPPGVDTLPIDMLFGGDKDWTWSKWTWSPGTGLSATTGLHVIVGGSYLTGPTTYTVTGTDSAMGMYSCATRQFVFTIKPCHFAIANNPCLGDTLQLDMTGDSTGATYYWYGPDAFTSHLHRPYIFPTVWADTGTYYVVKTVAGTHDTDFVHVIIHPLPVVTLTSNIATCAQIVSPLNLDASLDSVGETFSWSGPFGFTSTMQNPSVNPFDSSLQGTYVCTGTTVWGCTTTSSINIWPGITPNFTFAMHYGCNFDTVYFTNNSLNANTYLWSFGDATPTNPSRNIFHIYSAHQVYTVTLSMTNPHCTASVSQAVNLTHDIHAAFNPTPDTICFDGSAIVPFVDLSYADDSTNTNISPSTWAWNFGDGGTDVTAAPSHTYTAPGKFPVTLVVTDAMGCPDSILKDVYVVQLHVTSFHDTTLCLSQPLELTNIVSSIPDGFAPGSLTSYSWAESSPNLDNASEENPHVSGFGNFTDILTITDPSIVPDGCPVTDTVVIHSVSGVPVSSLTVSQTIDYGSSIQLFASGEVLYYWLPNDGSLDNNNINNPVATPSHTTTYTVFGLDGNGCLDSAYVTVYVDTSMTDGVPGAFTPNGDGINDIFKPVGIQYQNMVEMRIFNRWGEEIFYTNSRENGWDGTYHGVPQDMGTYFYQIIIARPGAGNKVYKGPLTLIR